MHSCRTAACQQPETWVVETAENAKRELSLVLSGLLPLLAVVATLLVLLAPGNDGGFVSLATVAGALLVSLPLAVVGFLNVNNRTRAVTVPVTVSTLLILALAMVLA